MKYLKLIIPPIFFIILKRIKYGNSRPEASSFQINSNLVHSYSQFGEDLVIDSIINKDKGFYIDIGANDPVNLSNTKRFYDKGWNGINIEPQSFKISEFNSLRERDVNLNLGVGPKNGELRFYQVELSALSSFNKEVAIQNCKKFNTRIEKIIDVPIMRLERILNDYLQPGIEIDFISIDTEGFEMEVLESNNWNVYRPNLIIIEYGSKFREICQYLNFRNYSLIFKNGCNLIFKKIE